MKTTIALNDNLARALLSQQQPTTRTTVTTIDRNGREVDVICRWIYEDCPGSKINGWYLDETLPDDLNEDELKQIV